MIRCDVNDEYPNSRQVDRCQDAAPRIAVQRQSCWDRVGTLKRDRSCFECSAVGYPGGDLAIQYLKRFRHNGCDRKEIFD